MQFVETKLKKDEYTEKYKQPAKEEKVDFSYNLKKLFLYTITFVVAIAFNDFMDRLFDYMTNKNGSEKISLVWNGIYVVFIFGITILSIYLFQMDAK
jgi:hypothetical protein